MRAIFGKWSPFFLALLIFQIVIILIVVIWTFGESSGFLKSIYDLVISHRAAFSVLDFIAEYAVALSGLVVCIALVILLVSLKRYHRTRAVSRLHSWARNGAVVLAQFREGKPVAGGSRADRYEEVRILIDRLLAGSGIALADARYTRGEIIDKTKSAVATLRVVRKQLASEDESVFENLQGLQHDFADIMILAFELKK